MLFKIKIAKLSQMFTTNQQTLKNYQFQTPQFQKLHTSNPYRPSTLDVDHSL